MSLWSQLVVLLEHPGGDACVPPGRGPRVDAEKHVALFPRERAILTTGSTTTHVASHFSIVLGPQDTTPTALSHEFGHIRGFPDSYCRGFRDRGAEGFEVLEVGTDPEDITSNPRSGRGGRHYFARIVGPS